MNVGDAVAWRWGTGIAEGTIVKISPKRTQITTKGKQIVRNGTSDNPAITIQHTSGALVLKLQTEIQKTS